ncbi:hypothetical protein ON010_g14394 [Phytophthora cinnamomi]|nr:hypothetical protein ON010_g14394 [Phytophthora cinnamomi]
MAGDTVAVAKPTLEVTGKVSAGKAEEEFRNYKDSDRHALVSRHYALMRKNQTVAFQEKMQAKYGSFANTKMTIWEAFTALKGYVDSSDPDSSLPNLEHMLQTAEGIRAAGHPDWFQLVDAVQDEGGARRDRRGRHDPAGGARGDVRRHDQAGEDRVHPGAGAPHAGQEGLRACQYPGQEDPAPHARGEGLPGVQAQVLPPHDRVRHARGQDARAVPPLDGHLQHGAGQEQGRHVEEGARARHRLRRALGLLEPAERPAAQAGQREARREGARLRRRAQEVHHQGDHCLPHGARRRAQAAPHLQPRRARRRVVEDPAQPRRRAQHPCRRGALRPHPSAPSGQHDRTLGGRTFGSDVLVFVLVKLTVLVPSTTADGEQYLDAGERRIHLCQDRPPCQARVIPQTTIARRAAFQLVRGYFSVAAPGGDHVPLSEQGEHDPQDLSSLAGTARVCSLQRAALHRRAFCPAKILKLKEKKNAAAAQASCSLARAALLLPRIYSRHRRPGILKKNPITTPHGTSYSRLSSSASSNCPASAEPFSSPGDTWSIESKCAASCAARAPSATSSSSQIQPSSSSSSSSGFISADLQNASNTSCTASARAYIRAHDTQHPAPSNHRYSNSSSSSTHASCRRPARSALPTRPRG